MATLVAIVDVSVRERRRTHRSVSVGLLAGAVALVAALTWWVVAVGVANGRLETAQRHSDAVTALDDARTAVLQARSAESLALVARSGGFASDDDFSSGIARVVGADGASGLLARADGGAPGSADRITALRVAVGEWQAAHKQVRDLDEIGNYTAAVASVVQTAAGGSGATFAQLDAELGVAIDAERAAFADATGVRRVGPDRPRRRSGGAGPARGGRGRGGPRPADRGVPVSGSMSTSTVNVARPLGYLCVAGVLAWARCCCPAARRRPRPPPPRYPATTAAGPSRPGVHRRPGEPAARGPAAGSRGDAVRLDDGDDRRSAAG